MWLNPVEYNVIIDPDQVEEKTAGGIILPQTSKETQDLAIMTGTLVAVSPLAFNYDTWPADRADEQPKAGDKVLYAKYAGTVIKDPKSGREVRICKDKDVIAVIKEHEHV